MENFMQMRIEKLKKDYENSDFPKTVSGYTVEEPMLPMRDGRRMKTVIYKPAYLEIYPVLFRRTCYPSDERLIKVDAGHLSLCREPSVLQTSSCGYTFDPDDPVPTNGGDCTLASWQKTGSLLQEKPGWRKDVISFLSEPLEKDMIINGQIEVELWVKTDCENTAFFASIDELTPEEKSYHIRTSATTIRHELPRGERYVPGTPVKVVVDMSEICYALSAGSCIRIDVTSSDFPQYHVHSNQPGDWAQAEENAIAHQTILTGKDYLSCVKIPCYKK